MGIPGWIKDDGMWSQRIWGLVILWSLIYSVLKISLSWTFWIWKESSSDFCGQIVDFFKWIDTWILRLPALNTKVACCDDGSNQQNRKKHLKKVGESPNYQDFPKLPTKNASNILEQNLKTLKNIFRGFLVHEDWNTPTCCCCYCSEPGVVESFESCFRRPTKSIKSIQSIHIQSSKSLIALQYSCHGAMGLQTQGEEFRRDLALIVTIMFWFHPR